MITESQRGVINLKMQQNYLLQQGQATFSDYNGMLRDMLS